MKHRSTLALALLGLVATREERAFARPSRPGDRPRHRPDAGVPAPSLMCVARLVVRQTEGASGCFIDERVTGAPGLLRYPCGGGAATATFRNGVFAGTVSASGEVTLSLHTRFHYTDGCDWTTTQTLRGALSGPVRFEYIEAPATSGRRCLPACHATGDVDVQRDRRD